MSMGLKEDVTPPTNCIGSSSATPGTGAIDMFNPLLAKKKLVKRVVAMWKPKGKKHGNNNNERK